MIPTERPALKVLALEPYYGGSHQAFIDGWIAHSRHHFTLLSLPAHQWKWRMRHAAITLATEIDQHLDQPWDILWTSDMLDLAQLRGLSRVAARLPAVCYFHENQLTYPVRFERQRDLHFGFTNLTSGLAADAVWFNSAFHRTDFLTAARALVRRMPDYQPLAATEAVAEKASVQTPGISPIDIRPAPRSETAPHSGPLHIVWAARWEHDKGPEILFEALARLHDDGLEFRLSVLGESFREVPEVFARARETLGQHIEHWGFAASRTDYLNILAGADLFVSTARHEFFGLSAVEAMAAGCRPLLPDRLAYPELLQDLPALTRRQLLYDGNAEHLHARLREFCLGPELARPGNPQVDLASLGQTLRRHQWDRRAPRLDDALAAVVE